MKPLAVDLCCGLGGWSEGFLAEGWDCIGFDIERHTYGDAKYPAQMVLQDILTLVGYQFRGKVSCIVASPPCQFFSYCAMPWTRAKKLAADVRSDPIRLEKELALFNACVRIGKEAGCPTVIENVKGAQPWVGRAAWHYGSFYLWGDVPALMPSTLSVLKRNPDGTNHPQGSWFKVADSKNLGARKNSGGSWFAIGSPGQKETGRNPVNGEGVKCAARFDKALDERRRQATAVKAKDSDGYERHHPDAFGWKSPRTSSGAKSARKAASALIAKIPLELARHIARTFKPASVPVSLPPRYVKGHAVV